MLTFFREILPIRYLGVVGSVLSPEYYLPTDKPNMLGRGELASLLFDLARPHEKAVGFVVDVVKTRGA